MYNNFDLYNFNINEIPCEHKEINLGIISLYGIPYTTLDFNKDKPIILCQQYNFPEDYIKRNYGYLINWDDFEAPQGRHGIRFWTYIVNELLKESNKITVSCTGAHGRTGTMLSIILHLLFPEITDPVMWLRNNYCKNAVETFKQIGYLKSLGIKTKVKI